MKKKVFVKVEFKNNSIRKIFIFGTKAKKLGKVKEINFFHFNINITFIPKTFRKFLFSLLSTEMSPFSQTLNSKVGSLVTELVRARIKARESCCSSLFFPLPNVL